VLAFPQEKVVGFSSARGPPYLAGPVAASMAQAGAGHIPL